ncbi:hypothetical protein QE152_g30369 [Popillia japonica]|uniref:Uncharacterized protein n=1 Tax=Popillia japonica TaxID=7064 RepID=A0AAW1JEW4_POPJA
MTEIVSHINEYHNDNIITVEDGYVTVENPSDNNTQCLHMFEVDKNYFLVRSLFDKKSQQILYTFYRMSDNNASRIIRFHSSAFNIQQKNGRLMHESHLRSEFDVTNAFSANLCKLRDLNFDKSVKIIIGNDNTCLKDINGDQVNISEFKMSMDESSRIEKLVDEESYQIWKFQIMVVFKAYGLADVVDGSSSLEKLTKAEEKDVWLKKDAKAQKIIVATIERRKRCMVKERCKSAEDNCGHN